MSQGRHIVLIGMMGAGKTTTGRLLASRLSWPYLDTDDEIERQTGKTVPQIWRDSGEATFRAQESRVLRETCASSARTVVAVGGGAVTDGANRDVIRASGLAIWLRANVSTLTTRVGSGAGRPLLDPGAASALSRLYEQREPLYTQLADLVFDVDRMSPPQVVERIVQTIEAEPAK